MKYIVAIILLFITGTGFVYADKKTVDKIVLDAGHGGGEPGALGRISEEKDLALAITLRVGNMLEGYFRNQRQNTRTKQIIYTRKTDVFIELKDRHKIANQAKADLFVSIHVNSSGGKRIRVKDGNRYKYITQTSASGTETYVLGLHRNSQKEGAIGEFGETATEEPGLLNPDDPMTAIIIAQYSEAFLANSVLLGTKIQAHFAQQNRVDRGVKQKGLEVLAGSAMPGVLVEIGFINNSEEEQYLNSEKGQQEVAEAIFKGIVDYIRSVEA